MTTNPFGVTRAGPEDEEALFNFLIPIYAENALQPVSAVRVRALVQRCIRMDRAIAGVIRGTDEPIIASIGLLIDQDDYTDDEHLRAPWAFTHPRHRRENHLKHMMNFAKWCQEEMERAAERPLPLVVKLLTSSDLEGQMRLYQRSIPQVGALFTWGTAPRGQYDQVKIGTGRGHLGRSVQGHTHRVGLHQPSPLLRHRSTGAA